MKIFITISFLLFFPFLADAQSSSFVLTNTDGKKVSTEDLLTNGRPKVFVFWSYYCKPCKYEMKGMRNIGKNWFEDYDAEIYFVSLENYPSDAFEKLDFLQSFLQQQEGVYAMHDENMKFYKNFDGHTIPKTVLVNGNGEIVQLWNAYDDGMERSVGLYFKKLSN